MYLHQEVLNEPQGIESYARSTKMSEPITSIYLTVFLLVISPLQGANLFYPTNIASHFVYFGRLAEALSQEGHTTSILVPSNANVVKSLSLIVEAVVYEVPTAVPYHSSPRCTEIFVNAALSESFLETMEEFMQLDQEVNEAFTSDCEALLQNSKLMKQLMDANYDMVVIDTIFFHCGYTLPYKLDTPYISFSIPFTMWNMRVPTLPSFAPDLIKEYTDRMSFLERLDNSFFQIINYSFLNKSEHFTRKYVPEKPPLPPLKLMQGSSLFFVLSDLIVSYPAPTMPNILHIGDIMARPAQPLPDDLKRYMDENKKGVILISFGSFVDHLPANITCKILKALSRLPYKSIWRVNKNILKCEVPSSVKIMSWFPQNDLLGHPNLKLFVTHCGLNGLVEAVYHTVPVLACPLTIDQPFNARVVESRGYGLRLNLKSFTEDELADKVNTIITDISYKANVKKASRILKERPQTPAKRASFWINHVIKHGSDHLRTKAFELSEVEFFMLDIYAFVSIMIIAGFAATLCCFWMTWKLMLLKVL